MLITQSLIETEAKKLNRYLTRYLPHVKYTQEELEDCINAYLFITNNVSEEYTKDIKHYINKFSYDYTMQVQNGSMEIEQEHLPFYLFQFTNDFLGNNFITFRKAGSTLFDALHDHLINNYVKVVNERFQTAFLNFQESLYKYGFDFLKRTELYKGITNKDFEQIHEACFGNKGYAQFM